MDYINYTEIFGDTLIELGFEKHKFTDDGRFKYVKRFCFGSLNILDGNSHFKGSIWIERFSRDYNISYLNQTPKTLVELFETIAKVSYDEGIENGKKNKLHEIRDALGLEN